MIILSWVESLSHVINMLVCAFWYFNFCHAFLLLQHFFFGKKGGYHHARPFVLVYLQNFVFASVDCGELSSRSSCWCTWYMVGNRCLCLNSLRICIQSRCACFGLFCLFSCDIFFCKLFSISFICLWLHCDLSTADLWSRKAGTHFFN